MARAAMRNWVLLALLVAGGTRAAMAQSGPSGRDQIEDVRSAQARSTAADRPARRPARAAARPEAPPAETAPAPRVRRAAHRVAQAPAQVETVGPGTPVAREFQAAPPEDFGPYETGGGEYFDDYMGGPDCCNNCCDDCCAAPHCPIYFRGEYLSWSMKGSYVPALVTTSPQNTARNQAGVLGQTGTSVLFGDQNLNTGFNSGARMVFGGWVSPVKRIEASYFVLGQSIQSYDQTSTGNPILARPYFDVNPASTTPAAQNANVLAYPNELTGAVHIRATSKLQGADLYATHNMVFSNFGCDGCYRVDFLAGYRFMRLADNLSIASNSTDTRIPATVSTNDAFATTNNFNGADVGMAADWLWGRWSLRAIGRLGLGGTTEHVKISGSNSSQGPAGGLLAQPSNIGSYHRTQFSTLPQLELKLGFDLTPRFRVNVGYDLIYWSRVARPGDQIDTELNLSQASGGTLNGSARPAFSFHETDLWVQGVSVGGEYRF